ncbi:MAG: ABC transporter ATP-binding protein [Candidatus Thermoplasmatota archaeon]|nr:ABC transporter ATP-binding protein [Candidatus Thermoplasmatota archaeon]
MASKTVMCPNCKNQITIQVVPGKKTIITCPSCGTKGQFTSPPEEPEGDSIDISAAIQVKNLTKNYKDLKAVNNVSFNVRRGEVFGFLGPNGAGKTTTIKSILGLIHTNSGQITINGIDIKKDSKKAHKYIGYLPEKIAFYDNLTALQNMYFYAEMKNVPKSECKPLIVEMGLEEAVNKKVGKFSKGMQQRLGMVQALLGNPAVLILDEPSGGLDPRGVALIRNKIKETKSRGASVFVSSHILAEVQAVCDRVGIISKGTLVAEDTVEKLRDQLNLKPKLVMELEKTSDEIISSIKKLEGVEKVEILGVMVHVTCNPKVKSKIILAVEESGGNILNIQTIEPTLEEVFIRFTEG